MGKHRRAHVYRTPRSILELLVAVYTAAHGTTFTVTIRGSCNFQTFPSFCNTIQNGLSLMKKRINDNNLIKTRYGFPVSIESDIVDDKGDKVEVENIYKKLFNYGQRQLSAIISPFTSELAEVALKVAMVNDDVIMLHNAGAASLYSQGYPRMFSTTVLSNNFTKPLIDLLHQLGSRSIVIIQGILNRWDKEVCEDSLGILQTLGWNVIAYIIVDKVTFLPVELASIDWGGVDVLLSCGTPIEQQDVWVTARFKKIHPKAFVFPVIDVQPFGGIGPTFVVDALTVSNWDNTSTIATRCPIWGSPAEFYTSYMDAFGEEPGGSAVEAIVAAQALIQGIARVARPWGSGINWMFTQQDLAMALRTLNESSILGMLSFKGNGGMVDRLPVLQQIQSFASQNGIDRYRRFRLVRADMNIVYPARTWLEKKLLVYPCEVGEEINETYAAANSDYTLERLCQSCPVGRARDASEPACEQCGRGYVAFDAGKVKCDPCPKGADCFANKTFEDEQLPAARGYYRVKQRNSLTFVACAEHLCLGKNLCFGNNMGMMCSSCKPFFTNAGYGRKHHDLTCKPCLSQGWIVAVCFLVFLFYWLLVAVVGILIDSSTNVFTNVSCIFIKIALNTLHGCGAVSIACAMPESRFTSGVFSLVLDPVSFPGWQECMVLGERSRALTYLVVGFLLIPCVFVMNLFMYIVYVSYVIWKEKTHWKSWARRTRIMRRRIVQWTITWVCLLYPCTLIMFLEASRCAFSERDYPRRDLIFLDVPTYILCDDAAHVRLRAFALVGLLLYGVGVPAVLMRVLYEKRLQLSGNRAKLMFGFLCNGFKPHLFYVEGFFLFRKFLIVFALVCPVRKTVGLLFVFWLCLTSLVLHAKFLPFESQDLFAMNQLEFLGNLFVTVKAIAGLLHKVLCDGSYVVFVDVYANYLEPTLLLAFLCFTAWCLLRSIVNWNLALKQLLGHSPIRRWEHVILRYTEPLLNFVVLDAENRGLYIGSLSHHERVFLSHFIAEILSTYLHVVDNFAADCMVTAVREAMAMCIAERRARAISARLGWKDVNKHVVASLKSRVSAFSVDRLLSRQSLAADLREDEKAFISSRSIRSERIFETAKMTRSNSASLKELQHAMMLCKADIRISRSTLFIAEPPPRRMRTTYYERDDTFSRLLSRGKCGGHVVLDSAVIGRQHPLQDDPSIMFDEQTLKREHALLNEIKQNLLSELTVLREKFPETNTSLHEAGEGDVATWPAGSDVNPVDVSFSLRIIPEDTAFKDSGPTFSPEALSRCRTCPGVDIASDNCSVELANTSVLAECQIDLRFEKAISDEKTSIETIMHETAANSAKHDHQKSVQKSSSNLRSRLDELEGQTQDSFEHSDNKSNVASEEAHRPMTEHRLARALGTPTLFATVANIDRFPPRDDNLLINAVIAGDTTEVQSLIHRRANVAQVDENGKEAWDYAHHNGIILAMIESHDPRAKTRSWTRKWRSSLAKPQTTAKLSANDGGWEPATAKRPRIRGEQARADVMRRELEPCGDAVQSRPTKRHRAKITGHYGEDGEGPTKPS
eukprot:TRINITY_DN7029_c0_g1_i2.p1 TRINITY_DN7029_c0_g1~~TRINITY_DN7029_c0_g1_i2.p1  ORF type:complete len:1549 (-),score=209.33 TRINITY_DN7029_c0_g1_i2:61-4707(-)